jgi:hypothetical protein
VSYRVVFGGALGPWQAVDDLLNMSAHQEAAKGRFDDLLEARSCVLRAMRRYALGASSACAVSARSQNITVFVQYK